MAFALLCARVEVLLDGIQHGAGEYDDAIVSVGGVIIVVIAVRANELFAQFVKHGTYMLAIWCSLIRAGARGGLYANRIVVDTAAAQSPAPNSLGLIPSNRWRVRESAACLRT